MNSAKCAVRAKTERIGPASGQHPRRSTEEAVAAAVQQRFGESSYSALHAVSCEYHEGMFVLRGTVPSFHMKQLAQELVRKTVPSCAIVNALEVSS